jgi:hypothetical protein
MGSLSKPGFFFWEDETVELNDKRIKKEIPKLPTITASVQTIKGGGVETLAFLALQIAKTTDKMVVLRAVASACSVLLTDSQNFTGARGLSVDLTGLDAANDDNVPGDQQLSTNFEDAEPVTVSELLTVMEADGDEIGAFFGIMFFAGNKRVTAQNRSAFNEKRAKSATASVIGDAKIFITDSQLLADSVLEKVYASFLSLSPLKANMTAKVVAHLGDAHMGPALAFMNMFLLLVDNGMSALRIIKEATLKNKWIRDEFPELAPEFAAANSAQNIIRKAPGHERSFLKAIHGNAFVPVSYSDIDNLTGVCKDILRRTTPSFQNYQGGKITESQTARLDAKLGTPDVAAETISAE